MQFFLDTADIAEIETALDWGMIDGITTNPSLIAKQGKPYLPTVREIARLVPGPVSGEVLATDYAGMIEQGHRVASLADNVVVKLPLGPEGLKAVRTLSKEGMSLIEDIVAIYQNYEFATQVLVASARHPMHIVQSALLGADVITMPFKVLEQLYKHPLTDVGLDRFLADWKKTGRSFDDEK